MTPASGILIIDGDLDVHGGLAFYGLILVREESPLPAVGARTSIYMVRSWPAKTSMCKNVAISDVIGGSFNFTTTVAP